MKFSFKDFFSEGDQNLNLLRIWLHLVKKSLLENFIFCVVKHVKEFTFSFYLTQLASERVFLIKKFCLEDKFSYSVHFWYKKWFQVARKSQTCSNGIKYLHININFHIVYIQKYFHHSKTRAYV